jgi:hypothetical protein
MYRYIKSALSDDFDQFYEDMKEIGQEFDSSNTSINDKKRPALFGKVNFEPGTVNLDYGGGKFDNVAEYLVQFDVINMVYDPYNRSSQHNREVIHTLWEYGGADSATCANVLNVIKEYEVRHKLLLNIKKLTKPNAPIYFAVYTGSKKQQEGGSRPTSKSSYQLFWTVEQYLPEIKEVFPDAQKKNGLIVCHNTGGAVTSSADLYDEDDIFAIDDYQTDYYPYSVMGAPSLKGFRKPEYADEFDTLEEANGCVLDLLGRGMYALLDDLEYDESHYYSPVKYRKFQNGDLDDFEVTPYELEFGDN